MAIVNVSKAVAGVGAQIQKWNPDAGPAAWQTIAEVTNITGPSASREMIDVTSLNTTGGYRKFIGSFRDAGTINLALNFTNDGLNTMKTDFESAAEVNYQISIKDADDDAVAGETLVLGTSLVFKGLVQEMPLTIPTDAQVTMDVVIKVTGGFDVLDVPKTTQPT